MRDKRIKGDLIKEVVFPYLICKKFPTVKVKESERKEAVSLLRRGKMVGCMESDRQIYLSGALSSL